MDWNEMRTRWQSSPTAEVTREDIEAVRERDRKLRGTVKRRDLLETVAALLILPFFVWFAWKAGTDGRLISAGFSLFIALWAGFVPLRLWQSRRQMPTLQADRPLSEYLSAEREAMLAQARMLESIWLWYLGPCVIGILGLVFSLKPPTTGTWIYSAVVVTFCLVIGYANRVAARSHFRAMADDIGRQLQQLNKEQ